MQIVKRKINDELYEYVGEVDKIYNEQEFIEISDYIFNNIQTEKTFYISDLKNTLLYFYHGYIKSENLFKQFKGSNNFIDLINKLRDRVGIPIYEDDSDLISIIASDNEIKSLLDNIRCNNN